MANSTRTFIALPLTESAKTRIGDRRRGWSGRAPGLNWTPLSDLHLTLAFLGEVDNSRLADIGRACAAAAASHAPFAMELAGVGVFPDWRRPTVLWLGIDAGRHNVVQLQGTVMTHLEPLGFRRETRAFSPHVTIGRWRLPPRDTNDLVQLASKSNAEHAGATIGCEVREIVVMSSELNRGGPIYAVMAACPLLTLETGVNVAAGDRSDFPVGNQTEEVDG